VEPEHQPHDEPHTPAPTLWPIGFAIGVVVLLVGLIINPILVSTVGAVIAIIFGILWAREATTELRADPVEVEPERRDRAGDGQTAPADEPATVTRNNFLAGTTLALGGLIGGLLTIPVAGFALLPSFLGQPKTRVDLGPISNFKLNRWYITTFISDPVEGAVSRRTAFIRNNGNTPSDPNNPKSPQVPSFSVISNHCAHLGCPVQANGPTDQYIGEAVIHDHTLNGPVTMDPVIPAGYGCPCHGGQYDTEGNRVAGPPVRALDRWEFEIDKGRLVLLSTFSVSHVVGTGATAQIYKYKLAGPGEHVDGPEQVLYPIQPPHN
jgi:Rieske Fe-S protein